MARSPPAWPVNGTSAPGTHSFSNAGQQYSDGEEGSVLVHGSRGAVCCCREGMAVVLEAHGWLFTFAGSDAQLAFSCSCLLSPGPLLVG